MSEETPRRRENARKNERDLRRGALRKGKREGHLDLAGVEGNRGEAPTWADLGLTMNRDGESVESFTDPNGKDVWIWIGRRNRPVLNWLHPIVAQAKANEGRCPLMPEGTLDVQSKWFGPQAGQRDFIRDRDIKTLAQSHATASPSHALLPYKPLEGVQAVKPDCHRLDAAGPGGTYISRYAFLKGATDNGKQIGPYRIGNNRLDAAMASGRIDYGDIKIERRVGWRRFARLRDLQQMLKPMRRPTPGRTRR